MNKQITITRQFVSLSSTIFTSRLISALTSLISFIFISRLSIDASASGSLITVIQVPIFTCATAFLYALSLLLSKAYGAKDNDQLARVVESAVITSILITVFILAIFLNLSHILILFHQPLKLIPDVQSYFTILSIGVLPTILVICLSQYFSSINRAQIIMKRMIILFPLSIILSYVLIFGKFGLPKLGIAGAAYAVTISYWFLFFWLMKIFLNCDETKAFIHKIKLTTNISISKQLFKIGFPIMIQNGTDYLFMFVLTLMIGWLGSEALAAQQIINQLNLFLFLIPFAIAQTASIMVSQNLGKNDFSSLIKSSRLAIISTFCISIAMSILLLLFSREIILIYISKNHALDTQLFKLIEHLFLIFIAFQFFNALRTVAAGLLRGMHLTQPPMSINLFSNWVVGFPMAYILGFYMHWGIIGINIAYLSSAVISLSLMIWYWISIKSNISFAGKLIT